MADLAVCARATWLCITVNEENCAVQAAISGQELVLASSVLVSDYVRHGLLAPYPPEVSVSGASYSALSRPCRERHPPVRAFRGSLGE